jgi:polyisoprenoid-binding protein YceI
MKDHDKLTNHLKSPDFFDVEKYPTGTFVITKVTPKNGPNGANMLVTGNLTVKGKTNPISFPAKINVNGNQLTADANFIMDRSKYDIRYGSKTYFPDRAVNDVIENEVNMGLKLVASK